MFNSQQIRAPLKQRLYNPTIKRFRNQTIQKSNESTITEPTSKKTKKNIYTYLCIVLLLFIAIAFLVTIKTDYFKKRTIKTLISPKEDARIILLGNRPGYIKHISDKTQFNITTVNFDEIKGGTIPTSKTFLIPASDKTSEQLAKKSKYLRRKGYNFLTSHPDIILYLGDKLNLQRNTKKPLRKYLPEEYDLSSAKFPCFLKKRSGSWSTTVHLIKNRRHYNTLIKKIRNKKDWFLQQAIPGNEYSVLLLVVNGNIIVNYTKVISAESKHNNEIFISGGGSKQTTKLRTENVDISRNVLHIFEKFLTNYNGLVDIDFKLLNDEPIILEFNTRISAQIYQLDSDALKHLLNQYILNSY
eukprot:56318_1